MFIVKHQRIGNIMNKQIFSVICKWASLTSITLAAVMQTAAIVIAYDPTANYFFVGTPLPYVAAALSVVGGILGILFALCHTPKNADAVPFSDSKAIVLPAAFCFAVCAILFFLSASGTLATAAAIVLLLAALYTILTTTPQATADATLFPILGFSTVIACALMNAYYYFDASMEMNAPVKVTVQTALLFAMLYYTAELRYLLNRRKPRLYLALAMLTLASAALSAIAIPVAFCIGRLSRMDYLAGAILTLGIAITVLLRVIFLLSEQNHTVPAPSNEEESTADPMPASDHEKEETDAE